VHWAVNTAQGELESGGLAEVVSRRVHVPLCWKRSIETQLGMLMGKIALLDAAGSLSICAVEMLVE